MYEFYKLFQDIYFQNWALGLLKLRPQWLELGE